MIKNAIENNSPFGIILSDGDGVYSKGVKVEINKINWEIEEKTSNTLYSLTKK